MVHGRTLRTGDLVVVDVVLGVAGALVGGFILSVVFESASSGVLFTLVTATAGGAVPVWLLQLTVAPSRPSTSRQALMATRAYLLRGEQHTDAQGVSSSQRSCARMRASSRDTCICDMPSCSAICDCVFSSKNRSATRWSVRDRVAQGSTAAKPFGPRSRRGVGPARPSCRGW
jgi:uncharacterized membrane protein YeaQ/YmgE (transglycosylase-associated protein family)